MTHETIFTVRTRFHNNDSDNFHTVDLNPSETAYMIGFIKDYNHMFTYLNSLKRWEEEIPEIADRPDVI